MPQPVSGSDCGESSKLGTFGRMRSRCRVQRACHRSRDLGSSMRGHSLL